MNRRLTEAERVAIAASLTSIFHRLDQFGGLLAVVHLSYALDCLDSRHPLKQPGARRDK